MYVWYDRLRRVPAYHTTNLKSSCLRQHPPRLLRAGFLLAVLSYVPHGVSSMSLGFSCWCAISPGSHRYPGRRAVRYKRYKRSTRRRELTHTSIQVGFDEKNTAVTTVSTTYDSSFKRNLKKNGRYGTSMQGTRVRDVVGKHAL